MNLDQFKSAVYDKLTAAADPFGCLSWAGAYGAICPPFHMKKADARKLIRTLESDGWLRTSCRWLKILPEMGSAAPYSHAIQGISTEGDSNGW